MLPDTILGSILKPFWCPFCNNHFVFTQLQKPTDIDSNQLEIINRHLIYAQQQVLHIHGEDIIERCIPELPDSIIDMYREIGVTLNTVNDDHREVMINRSRAIAIADGQ